MFFFLLQIIPGQLDTSPIKREQPSQLEPNQNDSTEDIYEFKEPEPFEFVERNKRDSSGSEKDKEKDKDKIRKRTLDEDLKSPKKRQKSATATVTTPAKVEPKTEQPTQPAESSDSKKKPRKIFKKGDDADEELEAEDSSKFISTTHSSSSSGGVVVYSAKRKPTMSTVDNTLEDESVIENTSADTKTRKIADEGDTRNTPKKRPTKNLLSGGSPAGNKINETPSAENNEAKKRARKVFAKKADEAEDDEDDSSKELDKFFSSYKPPRKNETIPEASRSTSEAKDAKLKRDEDLTVKSAKKRQKPSGVPSSESTDTKKKPVPRRAMAKRICPTDTEESESDETEVAPPREAPSAKYLSHYSGPKAKPTLTPESEATQDRSTGSKIVEPKKSSCYSSVPSYHEAEDTTKAKATAEIDKKRSVDQASSTVKSEPKQEMKTLDFTPVVPHSLPVPAPISTRLPATASIEEKLSLAAASVFRAKTKDNKREEEQPSEAVVRKIIKETPKKSEPPPSVKKVKEKEESKTKHEVVEKRKPALEQMVVPKKDPLQEFEPHHDPLLEVINKREEETSKPTSMPSVVKTYGNQKKLEHTAKVEEPASWKKTKVAAAAVAAASTSLSENSRIAETAVSKETPALRKEVAPSKIKPPSIDRDSVDSSDSSDSERRLTIIDSEDAADDKCNDFNSEVKTIKPIAESTNICYGGSSSSRNAQDKPASVNSLATSVIHAKIARPDEDGENLNSLLCEEEIPGSPTPGTDSTDQEQKASNDAKTPLKTEIGKFC